MLDFKCRICSAATYTTILHGELPLAADVCVYPSNNLTKHSINVVRCKSCGHIQLREEVEESLYDNYLFTPSYTPEFSAYIDAFCKILNDVFKSKSGKRILEIGCGTGSLLKKLKIVGWEVLGVELSTPMVKVAQQEGVNIIHGYFKRAVIEEIKSRIGSPNIVILRHVLEHLDDLNNTISLIHQILDKDGLLIIEVPYVKNTIEGNRFYDFYHEHLSYFSVSALKNLLSIKNFSIHHVYESPEGGGSILIVADCNTKNESDDNVSDYLQSEKNLLSEDRINAFSKGISDGISHLKSIVKGAKVAGQTVAGWGAGQRGCTLIAHCGFQSDDLQYVIDANENYWWRYVPGTDIQIVPPNYYREHMVDKMLIFATGYADSIISANYEFEQMGGSFIRIAAI